MTRKKKNGSTKCVAGLLASGTTLGGPIIRGMLGVGVLYGSGGTTLGGPITRSTKLVGFLNV